MIFGISVIIVVNIFKCMEEDGETFEACLIKEMAVYTWASQFLQHSGKEVAKRGAFMNTVKKSENTELFSFFRNAILKNYRLKSSLKTTRF